MTEFQSLTKCLLVQACDASVLWRRLKSVMRMFSRVGKQHSQFVMAGCLMLCVGSIAIGQGRLAAGRRFERQMESPASIYWSGAPLRTSFKELAATRRVGIWIDRRCDPSQKLSFKSDQGRLKDCLWQFATSSDLDVVWFDNIVYVAPDSFADRLATVHEIHREQLSKLPANVTKRWRSLGDFSWPRLTNPVELLEELEEELGSPLKGRSKVHHDLWAEQMLPRIPLYQRLELLLAGFDATFAFQPNGGARIISLPAAPAYEKSVRETDKSKAAEIREMLTEFPKAEWDGKKLRASWRVHQMVDRIQNPPKVRRNSNSIRYTLRAENQVLGKFVRGLCEQLDLECEFVDVTPKLLETRVTFEVKRATQRELFDAVLRPAGLEFSMEDVDPKRKLVVRPIKAD